MLSKKETILKLTLNIFDIIFDIDNVPINPDNISLYKRFLDKDLEKQKYEVNIDLQRAIINIYTFKDIRITKKRKLTHNSNIYQIVYDYHNNKIKIYKHNNYIIHNNNHIFNRLFAKTHYLEIIEHLKIFEMELLEEKLKVC